MEALRRLRVEADRFSSLSGGNLEMLQVRAVKSLQLRPPVVRRKIKFRRPHQVANAAALVSFLNPRPYPFEFAPQTLRLISQNSSGRHQIEKGVVRTCHGGIE